MPEGYARPEMLVETEWLASHLDDPNLRIVDADYPQSYARAHIPGAVGHLDPNIYMKTADGVQPIDQPPLRVGRGGPRGGDQLGRDFPGVVGNRHHAVVRLREGRHVGQGQVGRRR